MCAGKQPCGGMRTAHDGQQLAWSCISADALEHTEVLLHVQTWGMSWGTCSMDVYAWVMQWGTCSMHVQTWGLSGARAACM